MIWRFWWWRIARSWLGKRGARAMSDGGYCRTLSVPKKNQPQPASYAPYFNAPTALLTTAVVGVPFSAHGEDWFITSALKVRSGQNKEAEKPYPSLAPTSAGRLLRLASAYTSLYDNFVNYDSWRGDDKEAFCKERKRKKLVRGCRVSRKQCEQKQLARGCRIRLRQCALRNTSFSELQRRERTRRSEARATRK